MKIQLKCLKCQNSFSVYSYRKDEAKYCSQKCRRLGNRNCLQCGKSFKPSNVDKGYGFYCSRICFGISKRGTTPWNKGIKAIDDERIKRFVDAGHKATEGIVPWNKNLSWGNSAWLRKDDPNKYRNIHKRIYKKYGSPNTCEQCHIIGNNRRIHWANRDGMYMEKREDWIRLCVKCHIAFDKSNKTRSDLMI